MIPFPRGRQLMILGLALTSNLFPAASIHARSIPMPAPTLPAPTVPGPPVPAELVHLGLISEPPNAATVAKDAEFERLASAAEVHGPALGPPAEGMRFREGVFDFGRGLEKIRFVERDALAYYQGDMVLGSADRLVNSQGPTVGALEVEPGEVEPEGRIPVSPDSLITRVGHWPGGVMIYAIDETAFVPGTERRRILDAAIHAWNTQTLVRLVPRDMNNAHLHHVRIRGDQAGCWAMVGFQPAEGDRQVINLEPNCDLHAALHEIGHAVGLHHEQARVDRDTHLNLNFWNMAEEAKEQFLRRDGWTDPGSASEWGPYDLWSVMHYASLGYGLDPSLPVFNRRGCDPRDASPACIVPRNARLTTYDKAGVTRIVTGDPAKLWLRGGALGNCLAVLAGGLEDGVPIVDQACADQSAQRFYPYDDGGEGVLVVNEGSRLCITADGDHLLQRPCTGAPEQRFRVTVSEDDDGGPVELPAIAPSDLISQRSDDGGAATQVEFVSQWQDWLHVYWVDGDGCYHYYFSLAPGGRYLQGTYAGHLWAVVDTQGYIVAGYRAVDRDAVAVIR